jgi:pilus assembly protein CpaB
MKRIVYIVGFCIFALVAAGLTLRAQQTVAIAVATHDLSFGTQVTAQDIQIIRVHSDGAPSGVLTSEQQAIGQYVKWPIASGEPVLGRLLSSHVLGSDAAAGFNVPRGYQVIALPIQPASAVGGVVQPGDRVDVYATSLPSQANATAGTAQLLGQNILLLQLRTDQGAALTQPSDNSSSHTLSLGPQKLGSAVLAVPSGDVAKYASAIAQNSFYLALSIS